MLIVLLWLCIICMWRSSLLDSSVAANTGIKAKPCSLCTGKPGYSFIKPSATSNGTEMLDSSHSYSIGECRKQTVSTLQYTIATLFSLLSLYLCWTVLLGAERQSLYFVCSSEIRKITSHIQTGNVQHIHTNMLNGSFVFVATTCTVYLRVHCVSKKRTATINMT